MTGSFVTLLLRWTKALSKRELSVYLRFQSYPDIDRPGRKWRFRDTFSGSSKLNLNPSFSFCRCRRAERSASFWLLGRTSVQPSFRIQSSKNRQPGPSARGQGKNKRECDRNENNRKVASPKIITGWFSYVLSTPKINRLC